MLYIVVITFGDWWNINAILVVKGIVFLCCHSVMYVLGYPKLNPWMN